MRKNLIYKICSFVLVCMFCVLALVGCTPGMDLPETNAGVSGNGGLAVQKGEYLYFVNGYTSIESMKDGDNKGGNSYSAIYRVKLGDNNTLIYNEDGELENCELIIDKVCGFDKTALYIFGDYIYYASPNTQKVISDESTVYNFKLTDFYRAKLDGTGRTLIYKTNNASDDTKFAFYKTAELNDVYLACFDGSKLVVINCSNGSQSFICENVSSVAMPEYSDYNALNNQLSVGASNIYYTRSTDDLDGDVNLVCYAKLGDSEEHVIAAGTYKYTVKQANNYGLVYTKKLSYEDVACNYVINYNGVNGAELDLQNGGKKLDSTGHSTIYLTTFEDGNATGFVAVNNDTSKKLVYIKLNANNTTTPIILNESLSLTPLTVAGNYVYAYDENNNVYQINYKTLDSKLIADTSLTEDEEIKKPYFEGAKKFSVCGNYIYYFATYEGDSETGYYLNRINASVQETYKTELVGVVDAKYIKTEIESESE